MVVRQLFKHTKEDLQSYKIKSGQLKQSYLDYISEFHLSETTRGKAFIGFCFSRERLQNLHPSLFFLQETYQPSRSVWRGRFLSLQAALSSHTTLGHLHISKPETGN